MTKESFIFGKNLTPEDSEKESNALEKIERESLKQTEGEMKKTPEETRFIKKIDSYLKEEFKEIGIEKKPEILPERIHFLDHEAFKKVCPKKGLSAFVSFPQNAAYLDKSSPRHRLELYKTILHESVHLLAFQKIHVDAGEKVTRQYRRGYYVNNPKEEEHEHFRGLGEAIADKTAMELFNKHAKELITEFNITSKEENLPVEYQTDYIEILDTVIKKIAEKNNENENVVWQRFKKGQFSGEIMHLRDVENTFGVGSLRILAALDSGIKNLSRVEVSKKILRYFEAENQEEKNKIASEVLIEREKLRYQNLKKKKQ